MGETDSGIRRGAGRLATIDPTSAFGSSAVLAAALERPASPLSRHDFAGLSPALEGER